MSSASTAIGSLDKAAWTKTTPAERLTILQQFQLNLYEYQDELSAAEAAMKNARMNGEELYNTDNCKITTAFPMGNNITAAIDLYSALVAGKEYKPTAGKITQVEGDIYDIAVAPNNAREMVLYGTRKDRLRVQGEPVQKGPYDKEAKLIAVLGAGNYSSPVEICKAIFFDGHVVAHKPHPLNDNCDKVWSKIMEPAVQAKALAFCAADQGPAMTSDDRVDEIYFTGGADTARAIQKSTHTPMVCESGGVNPALIVPGDRVWTEKELQHHAQQIITMGKINGGAVCARIQLVVTCKNWPQRDAFLEHLLKAAQETTFATGSYYPGAQDRMESFAKAYPEATTIQPESGAYEHANVLLVTGDKEDGYGAKHEAFAQFFSEVPLDTDPNAKAFLEYAVDYCNTKVLGTLCAGIIIDETTRTNHEASLQTAITNLQYGTVGVNLLPAHAFFSPYLIWGGHDDEHAQLVSGRGHFGNAFGYENIDKSIIEDAFVSPGHIKYTNKAGMDGTIMRLANFGVWNSWYNLSRFLFTAIGASLKSKDW